jgi:hypothetical protein
LTFSPPTVVPLLAFALICQRGFFPANELVDGDLDLRLVRDRRDAVVSGICVL